MHVVPILCKYAKDTAGSAFIQRVQESLHDDLVYCRVPTEKLADLSTLIYFIDRSANCSCPVLPKFRETFVSECKSSGAEDGCEQRKLESLALGEMQDRAFRMFTWVYLSVSDELNPEPIVRKHIDMMNQINFDAEMYKQILNSLERAKTDNPALKLDYLKQLAFSKLIDNETAIKGPEVDLIELVSIFMDNLETVRADCEFFDELLSAAYFKVVLRYPSLTFFRLRHLHAMLDILAESPTYSKEVLFWSNAEQLISRVMN